MARSSTLANLGISFLAMFAWLVATNHCATAMIVASSAPATCHGEAATASHHCHEEENGQGRAPAKDSSEACCKNFKAATNDDAAPQFNDSALKLLVFGDVVELPSTEEKSDLDPHFLDSGPPRSFAETVLQRSILAHAPPSFA